MDMRSVDGGVTLAGCTIGKNKQRGCRAVDFRNGEWSQEPAPTAIPGVPYSGS